MIALLSLIACGPGKAEVGDTETGAPAAFVPSAGDWAMMVGQTWEGDCALDEPATLFEPEQTWTLDPRGDHLVIYPDFWDVTWCALDVDTFSCDMGSWSTEDTGSGAITVSYLLGATFGDETHLSGAYTLALDCTDRACRTLKSAYGDDLVLPCSASAEVEGALAEEG